MNLNNFTIKSQEAIQKAQELAIQAENQAIETAHILKGILIVDEEIVSYALKKVNANFSRIEATLESMLSSFAKVSGGGQHSESCSKGK